jgi:hypothetical protein
MKRGSNQLVLVVLLVQFIRRGSFVFMHTINGGMTGAYRQCLLFKHDDILKLELKYNFDAKIFLNY